MENASAHLLLKLGGASVTTEALSFSTNIADRLDGSLRAFGDATGLRNSAERISAKILNSDKRYRDFAEYFSLLPGMCKSELNQFQSFASRVSSEFQSSLMYQKGADRLTHGDSVAAVRVMGDKHPPGVWSSLVTTAYGARFIVRSKHHQGTDELWSKALSVLSEDWPQMPTCGLASETLYWRPYLEEEPCETRVHSLERNFGRLLCFAQALNLTDLHYENLLLIGDHPVPSDTETILHPPWITEPIGPSHLVSLGCFKVGILPTRDPGASDVSGLSKISTVFDLLPSSRERLVSGYREAWTRVRERSDELRSLVKRASGQFSRLLLRRTSLYSVAIAELWHPEVAAGDRSPSAVLDRLRPPQFHPLDVVYESEIEALREGSVPMFLVQAGHHNIYDASAALLSDNFLPRTPIDGFEYGLMEEFEKPEGPKRASRSILLATSPQKSSGIIRHGFVNRSSRLAGASTPQHLAQRIADLLRDTVQIQANCAFWDDRNFDSTIFGASPAPIPGGLYSGSAGIAYFLERCSRRFEDDGLRDLAMMAMRYALLVSPEEAAGIGHVGAFVGAPSVWLVGTQVRSFWALRVEIGESVRRHVESLTVACIDSGRNDLVDGLAGLAGVLRVVSCSALPSASVAGPCYERCRTTLLGRLRASPKQDEAGLAHGVAGVQLISSKLTPGDGLPDPLEQATGQAKPPNFEGSWCRGKVGIVRSELGAMHGTPSPTWANCTAMDVLAMLDDRHRYFGRDLCLCHGALGAASLLTSLSALADDATRGRIDSRNKGLVEELDISDSEFMSQGFGYMTGIAGIGDFMLKMAYQEHDTTLDCLSLL
jgi:hypothetical protein